MVDEDVSMKQRVEDVLTESGYHDSRAAKMDVNDLLKSVLLPSLLLPHPCPIELYRRLTTYTLPRHRLLSAFHDAGIHFA